MTDVPKGFERGEDGVLRFIGGGWTGTGYQDPGEALKVWWGGKERFGCTERKFENYRASCCGKTPTKDPDANGNFTKCGHHSAAKKASHQKRRDDNTAKWKADWARDRAISEAVKEVEPALRAIAEGHNDPRALAQQVIAALDAARGTAPPEPEEVQKWD